MPQSVSLIGELQMMRNRKCKIFGHFLSLFPADSIISTGFE